MTVAVIGCGSIGLLAIQWARFGAARVCIHRYRYRVHKLDIATSLGAHQTINSEENLEKFIENNYYANQIDLAIELVRFIKLRLVDVDATSKKVARWYTGIPYR